MTSIDELILNQLPGLTEAWEQNNEESSKILHDLTEATRDNNWLLDFSPIAPPEDKTMVAIDGANAKESLQAGDLIATGASVAEAQGTKAFFTGEQEELAEAFIRLLPHRTNNDHLMVGVRAAQELILFSKARNADYRILDGAYLGSVSEVIARISSGDKILAKIVEDELAPSGHLSNALYDLLTPPRDNKGNVIAVVKSDTATAYAKVFQEKFKVQTGTLGDRMIADRILKPGQFLAPRYLDSNPQVIDMARTRQRNGTLYENEMNPGLMDELVTENLDKLDLLRAVTADATNEGVLWTTYFKPTAWGEEDKSIRIEFPFYRSNANQETVREHAARMVQIIDQDIYYDVMMEPWCQYQVDREAKKVSDGLKMGKAHLSETESGGRFRSYRS